MALKKTRLKRVVSVIAKGTKRPLKANSAPPRRTAKPKKKATTTKKADTLFSKWIRERDGKCMRCGKAEYLQNSHYFARAISAVRYDPENCDTLCYGCHYGDRINGWEYNKQTEYRDFKLAQLGEEKYMALCARAKQTVLRKDAIRECLIVMQSAVQLDNESVASIKRE